jgi:5-methylcytosine-specific restriction protein A
MKLRKPCGTARCGGVTAPGASYCAACAAVRNRARGSASARGYDAEWRRLRLEVLERDGWVCQWCGREANCADHVVPKAHGGARLDPANLVASCTPCNSRRAGQMRGAAMAQTVISP